MLRRVGVALYHGCFSVERVRCDRGRHKTPPELQGPSREVQPVLRHRRYREALRAEIALRQRLLDKLGSVEELRAYLESAAARQLPDLLQPSAAEAYHRIIRFTVSGAVLVVIGLASFGVVLWTLRVGSPGRVPGCSSSSVAPYP